MFPVELSVEETVLPPDVTAAFPACDSRNGASIVGALGAVDLPSVDTTAPEEPVGALVSAPDELSSNTGAGTTAAPDMRALATW